MRTEPRVIDLVPRATVGSLEELLAGATNRRPFEKNENSKSGAVFEQVEIGGESFVLKHLHVDDDWIMRACGNVASLSAVLWRSGLMDVLPESIDHGIVGIADGLGRNGWGSAVLMRNLSSSMVPLGDDPISLQQHLGFLDHMAQLSARFWGWEGMIGLTPMTSRWSFFGDDMVAAEAALGFPDPVPGIVQQGWAEFAERAPSPAREIVLALHRDASPFIDAVLRTPQTFLHGDWKLGNLGTHDSGRTVLIDWAVSGIGPACGDLAWYLAINRVRLPQPKEDAIGAFRSALESHGVETAGWWDRQLHLCLLGAFVLLGWEKVLGDTDELAWWCDRAVEGAAFL